MSLDRYDRKILTALQADVTVSMTALGEHVGLSQSRRDDASSGWSARAIS
jgi:DNA-binding Lrp family transcriptional regulator